MAGNRKLVAHSSAARTAEFVLHSLVEQKDEIESLAVVFMGKDGATRFVSSKARFGDLTMMRWVFNAELDAHIISMTVSNDDA